MKKFVLIVGACILIAVGVLIGVFWWMGSQPLYEPGMVRRAENLSGPLRPPPQDTVDSTWVVEDGIRLFYEAHGEGRPVVIVHGGPGAPLIAPWQGLQPLEDRYQFIYYHQRGTGNSSRPFDTFKSRNFYANMTRLEQTLGVGAHVADLERIRQILGEDKLILIGHSFGGFLAAMYAAEFPDRTEALVLVAPAGVLVLPNEQTDLYESVRDRLPAEDLAEYDALIERQLDFGGIFARTEDELAQMHREFGQFYRRASGDVFELDDDLPPNGGWMVQAVYFSMGRRHDYRASLADVDVPVLILHGHDDQMALAGSRCYADCFPRAEFQVLGEGDDRRAGHFVFNDLPLVFAEAVDVFLKE